jgi:hypothetical protein
MKASLGQQRSASLSPTLIVIGFALCLAAGVSFGSDWQFFGYTKQDNIEAYQFFDSESIQHPADNTARVWLKSIRLKNLDRHINQNDKALIEKAAKKVASGYSPAFFQLEPIQRRYEDKSELMKAGIQMTLYEVAANADGMQSVIKMYFEVDCKGRRYKVLDGIFYKANGDISPRNFPRRADYEYISPDSNAEWLRQMVCSH